MTKQTNKINKSDAEIQVEYEAGLNIANPELYQRMMHTNKVVDSIMRKHHSYAIWIFTACVLVSVIGIVLAILDLHGVF